MSEPREFWLDPLLSPPNSIYTEPSESCIHVIEFTAYEALQKELEQVRASLADSITRLNGMDDDAVTRDLNYSKLQTENDRLRAVLEDADGLLNLAEHMWKDSDHEKRERIREALAGKVSKEE